MNCNIHVWTGRRRAPERPERFFDDTVPEVLEEMIRDGRLAKYYGGLYWGRGVQHRKSVQARRERIGGLYSMCPGVWRELTRPAAPTLGLET